MFDESCAIAREIALTLQAIVEKLRIGRRLRRVARIANVEADIGIEADIAQCTADLFFAPDKDRMAKPRIAEGDGGADDALFLALRSEEHTSELQSLMRISYAVFCLKKKNTQQTEKQYANAPDHTSIIH